MLFAFLVVLYVSVSAFGQDDACEVSADEVAHCALQLCDFDGDGKISRAEVQFVFDNVLSGVSGIAARLLSSPERVLEKCGTADGKSITVASFEDSTECIDSCFKRHHFNRLVCVPLQDADFRQARLKEFAQQ